MPRSEGDERLMSPYRCEPPEPRETSDFVDRAYREPTGEVATDAHVQRVRWWYALGLIYDAQCLETNRRPRVET